MADPAQAPVARAAASNGMEPVLDRCAYLFGVGLVPTMVLELMLLAPSLSSVAVAAGFIITCLLRGPRLIVNWPVGLHLVAVGYFVLLAVVQPGWGVAVPLRLDILQAAQAIAAAPLLAGFLDARPDYGRRFLPDTARILLALGGATAAAGLAKLGLLSQGVLIEFLFLDDGRYPAGAALQHDYNFFAFGLLVCLGFGLWLIRTGSNRADQIGASLAVPAMAIAIALSTSRRGFLMLLPILGFHFAGAARSGRHARTATVVLAALGTAGVGAALLVATGAVQVGDRLDLAFAVNRLLGTESAADLFATRAPLFGYALDRLATETSVVGLLFGTGMSYLTEMGRVFSNPTGFEYPHNFLLSALLHGGFALAATMLAMVGAALRASWHGRRSCSAVLIALAVGLVFALSSSSSLYSTELLYFLTVAAVVPPAFLPSATAPPGATGALPAASG